MRCQTLFCEGANGHAQSGGAERVTKPRATRRRLAGSTDEPMHTCSSSSSSTEARDACAHVIGVRRRMHKNRKRAGCSRVVRVRASRRRTHKVVSADSPSNAFSGIAVNWLAERYLRARDEAPRQSSEAPCDVSQAAWRGVDARERAGHNRACESACRLEPRSLARCCAAPSCAPPDACAQAEASDASASRVRVRRVAVRTTM